MSHIEVFTGDRSDKLISLFPQLQTQSTFQRGLLSARELWISPNSECFRLYFKDCNQLTDPELLFNVVEIIVPGEPERALPQPLNPFLFIFAADPHSLIQHEERLPQRSENKIIMNAYHWSPHTDSQPPKHLSLVWTRRTENQQIPELAVKYTNYLGAGQSVCILPETTLPVISGVGENKWIERIERDGPNPKNIMIFFRVDSDTTLYHMSVPRSLNFIF